MANSPFAVAGLVTLLAAGGWDPAQTKYDCRDFNDVKTGLAQRGETPRAAGVVGAPSNGQLLMFFRSEQGGWTIVAVDRVLQLGCVGNYGTQWSTGTAAIDVLMKSPVPLPPLKTDD